MEKQIVTDVKEPNLRRLLRQMELDKKRALNVVDKEKKHVLVVQVMVELDVMFVMVFKY